MVEAVVLVVEQLVVEMAEQEPLIKVLRVVVGQTFQVQKGSVAAAVLVR
jgi:hypothetical protein